MKILPLFSIVVLTLLPACEAQYDYEEDSSYEDETPTRTTSRTTTTTTTPKPFLSFRNRRSFGEGCNKTSRCDKRAWLNCIEGNCACMQPDDMLYSPEKNQCVTKSGERCKFQINGGSPDEGVGAIFEQTACVPNAICGPDGLCSCLSTHYEKLDGTCSPRKGESGPCSADPECRADWFLSCINGSCACNSTLLPEEDRNGNRVCRGMAGKVLQAEACVSSAVPNAERICSCQPDSELYPGSDGRCHERKGRHQPCLQDLECRFSETYLRCVNGTCGCMPETSLYREFVAQFRVEKERQEDNPDFHRYYDVPEFITVKYTELEEKALAQCVGLAGKSCSSDRYCVQHSECLEGSSPPTCTCLNGYSETSKGTCGLGYDGNCSPTADCSDSFVCTEGQCKCQYPFHQTFNSVKGKCVGLIYGTCADEGDCVENAVCRLTNPRTNLKQCQCREGFVENGAGTCDLAHGSKCKYNEPSLPCDALAGLVCRNEVCACPNYFTEFDVGGRRCQGLSGSRCSTSDFDSATLDPYACTYNANCVSSHSKLLRAGVCKCKAGFVESSDRGCVLNWAAGAH